MKSGRRLYAYILTRLHLLGSPLRAAPNLTVTAVYPRLSRALVLPEEDFELGRSIHCSFPGSVVDQCETSGLGSPKISKRSLPPKRVPRVRTVNFGQPITIFKSIASKAENQYQQSLPNHFFH